MSNGLTSCTTKRAAVIRSHVNPHQMILCFQLIKHCHPKDKPCFRKRGTMPNKLTPANMSRRPNQLFIDSVNVIGRRVDPSAHLYNFRMTQLALGGGLKIIQRPHLVYTPWIHWTHKNSCMQLKCQIIFPIYSITQEIWFSFHPLLCVYKGTPNSHY